MKDSVSCHKIIEQYGLSAIQAHQCDQILGSVFFPNLLKLAHFI